MMKRYSDLIWLVTAVGAICSFANAFGQEQKSPREIFRDAVVFCDFSSADNPDLIPKNGVDLGVALEGKERQDSLTRGGDGLVAKINKGGYLAFSNKINESLKLRGQELTFGVRVKCSPDVWKNSPLMSKHGGHDKLAFNLFYLDDQIGAEIGSTGNNALLSCRAPACDMRDPENVKSKWLDVYCRVNSAKMELFVDGRCYDEDFVVGELKTNDVQFAIGAQFLSEGENAPYSALFDGEIDCFAVWKRALTDEEIITLAGGEENADTRQRTERIYPESMNYWTPPNNYGVGDCMPFCVDGVFHFMYLLDKNRHGAKNGLGAHQWIQAVSTDLKHWKHLPFVIQIDNQNEGSICTGSVFYYEGTYYAFYASRAVKYTLPNGDVKNVYGLLSLATSSDGVHFEKKEPQPLFLLPEGYGPGTRDPVVFKSPSDGRFHMYITTNYYGKGCWAHAVSDDLKKWDLLDPVFTHKNGEPECPDWFKWGDYYYVIANHLNGYYKRSKSPLGPWEEPNAPNILLNGAVNVPKTAPWGENRRIICGWTRERGFGGSAVFHELVLHKDGTLGEKFVPEMIPETDVSVVVEKNLDAAETKIFETPDRFRLKMEISFKPDEIDLLRDLILKYEGERQLRIVFSARAVTLNDFTMEKVDFSSGRLELDMIVTKNIVDVCVDNSRTITDAVNEPQKRSVRITNEASGKVRIDSLTISPLK